MYVENEYGEFVRVVDGFVEQGRAKHVSPYDQSVTPEVVTSRTPIKSIMRTNISFEPESMRPTFSMYVVSEPNGSRRVIEIAFSDVGSAREAGEKISNAAFQPVNY